MRLFTLYLFLLSALILHGCATRSAGQPDWINGKSVTYPDKQYLIGRGQADHAAVARDRARADLAKVFQVNISEQSEDILKHSQSVESGESQSRLESELSRAIFTTTEQTISGIQIADLWQNPKNKQYHALAILDRLKTGNSLRQEIEKLDSMTATSIANAKRQTDLLAKIGDASQAVSSQQERQYYQRFLKIVDTTGMGVPVSYNIASLINDRDAILKRLRIRIEISNDPIGGIETIITGALSKTGFLNQPGRQANYKLTADLQLNQISDKEGWHWYRGSLEIALAEILENQNRGSHRWDIKVSAQDPGLAEKRVRDVIDRDLKNDLRNVVINFGTPD